jgi:hypothetical protein
MKTISQLGWCRNGFLLPDEFIGGDESDVRFVPESDGIEQIREAVKPTGTMRGWLEGVASIADYGLVTTGIYAALSSVLLEPLLPNDGNPIIDWAYRTSTGKTTTLQIAASVWGAQRDMLINWDGTQQGLIGRAIALNHLPTIIDDSKTAREAGGKSMVPRVIYTLSSGTDSIRNSTNGLRETKRFRTTVLSTGEDKIIDADKSGGTVARVLSIWGSPFGGESETIKAQIATTKAAIEENSGLAGPVFARYVVANKSKWVIWKERLNTITNDIQNKLCRDQRIPPGMLDRSARVVALLQVTAEVAHECISFPWPLPDMVKILTPSLVGDSVQANRELECLKWMFNRIASMPQRVVSDIAEYEKAAGGVALLGVHGKGDFHTAFFLPSLEAEIKYGGFNPRSIMRAWRENGWVVDGKVDWLPGTGNMVLLTNNAALDAGVDT